MTDASPPPPDELVYAPAVVILSTDLYPRKLEIVREYIQNASDALDAFAAIAGQLEDDVALQIKISIQGKSLLIWDSGIGMDEQEIQKLKRIAYSEKKEGREAGYKGIGRLAGIAVAKKLIISSTSYGDPCLHKFEFRARAFQEDIDAARRQGLQEPASAVINRHTAISDFPVDPDEHYTLVELRDIDDKYHPDLLNPDRLREYVGDIGPVGFSPEFNYGQRIADHLAKHVPDFSPKTIWLTTATGDRVQIFKPYSSQMQLSEPEFAEVTHPAEPQQVLAYCWYASKGKPLLGKVRAIGGKFTVEGDTPDEKKRLAGLVYKLFGFSIGDRALPLRTLWSKDYTRPLWFTGEIHIVDKAIRPTTDRSDFVDNDTRRRLYDAGCRLVALRLNREAQVISDVRQTHDLAEKHRGRFEDLAQRLKRGDLDRAELKVRRDELNSALEKDLKTRTCKDPEVQEFLKKTAQQGRALLKALEQAKPRKDNTGDVNDLAKELGMTSQARKVFTIIRDVLVHHYEKDRDTYYELFDEIKKALKRKY